MNSGNHIQDNTQPMQHALNQFVNRVVVVFHPDTAWMERDADEPRLSP